MMEVNIFKCQIYLHINVSDYDFSVQLSIVVLFCVFKKTEPCLINIMSYSSFENDSVYLKIGLLLCLSLAAMSRVKAICLKLHHILYKVHFF